MSPLCSLDGSSLRVRLSLCLMMMRHYQRHETLKMAKKLRGRTWPGWGHCSAGFFSTEVVFIFFSSAEFNLEWWLSSRFCPGYVGTDGSFSVLLNSSKELNSNFYKLSTIHLSINCIFNQKFIAKHIAIFTKTKITFSFLWMKWKNLFIAIKIQ